MAAKKVFFIINSLALGGAERQMCELVRRIPRERFEPVLCTLGKENAYQHLLPPDQPRYVVSSRSRFQTFYQVSRWLARERPDIIHSFMEWSNFVARLCAPAAGRPVVITSVRSRMMRLDYAMCEGLLSRRSHAVVVNSIGTRQELIKLQRVPREKVLVIGNIINFDLFRPGSDEEKNAVRKELGWSGRVFLLPGRVAISKNQAGLILAAASLKKRGCLPGDVKFVFAGFTTAP
jgi:glycosyltransferase involved in cell wall biosynthesis